MYLTEYKLLQLQREKKICWEWIKMFQLMLEGKQLKHREVM